jgi:AraC-like DNA-binding protein
MGLAMVSYLAASRNHQAARISWHEHQHYEIVMVLQGASGWEFPDNTPVHLSGGEFKVVPPRMPHRGLQDMRSPSMICIVGFHPEAVARGRTLWSARDAQWLESRFGNTIPAPGRMSLEMRRAALALHRGICQFPKKSPSPEVLLALRILVQTLILEAAKHESSPPDARALRAVARACEFMRREFFRPLQIDAVAEYAECSRSQLYSEFKKQIGLSPNDWLLRHRVQQAEIFLSTTNRTVEDIAESVGFSSSPYFCTVFRKYTGFTPGTHRKRGGTPEQPSAP